MLSKENKAKLLELIYSFADANVDVELENERQATAGGYPEEESDCTIEMLEKDMEQTKKAMLSFIDSL